MAFQVPAADVTAGEDFEFDIDGAKFKVRKVNLVPIATLDEIEGSTAALVAFFGGKTAKQRLAVQELNRDQFTALVTAWREDSEVTAGESPASES